MRADEINSVDRTWSPNAAQEVWGWSHLPFSSNMMHVPTGTRFHYSHVGCCDTDCEQGKTNRIDRKGALNVSGENLVIFFNDTATTEIYTLTLHDALPISV